MLSGALPYDQGMSETTATATEQRKERTGPAVWFELPATDFARAVTFYETILQVTLKQAEMGPQKLGVFPYQMSQTGGCIVQGEGYTPGFGPILYFNADPSLDAVLARVEAAGGKILLGRTELPPGMGCYAHIQDTEGNRVGLGALA